MEDQLDADDAPNKSQKVEYIATNKTIASHKASLEIVISDVR